MLKMKKAIPQKAVPQEAQVKGFFDLVSPGVVKFNVDYYRMPSPALSSLFILTITYTQILCNNEFLIPVKGDKTKLCLSKSKYLNNRKYALH